MSLIQYSVLTLAVFSFTAKGEIITFSAHATPLIQHYLVQHPVNKKTIAHQQKSVIKALKQSWQGLSLKDRSTIAKSYRPESALLPTFYPIHSQLLTPGKVVSKRIQAVLPVPFFIVGDDARSISWLQRYQHRLTILHAKGFVVNVKTKNAMHTLQARFSALSLMAIPGDALAKWLRLHHYPALISDYVIEQ